MGFGYQVAYAIGVTPWEGAGEAGAEELNRWLEQVEVGRSGPGRALDLGCGSGVHSVSLAERGWEVTGVDQVGRALSRARRLADQRGARVRFVQGDVTRLDPLKVGTEFDLLLDVGCFHGLSPAHQLAMGRSVASVAAADATLLMLAFRPGTTPRPLPRGADAALIEKAFPGWSVLETQPATTAGMPAPLRKAAPTWYRVSRTS
jgi:SAM-dependent methyltransferase